MSFRETTAPGLYNNAAFHKVPLCSGTIPLSMAEPGVQVHICSIKGRDDTKRFLNSLGFVEDAPVTVVSELAGNVIVNIKNTRVAISKAMAARILTD